MIGDSIMNVDENVLRHKFFYQNTILHEYEVTVASLKEELDNCKLEQNRLRTEIEAIHQENQKASDVIHRSLMECSHEKCNDASRNGEAITNLEKRITILQMEKDSIFQLWQMALKAIDVLEDELKIVHKEDKNTKFYQGQINSIKETYSEAIKILESKLIAAKENFFQQQTLWEKGREKIDQLTKEKNEILEQLNVSQRKASETEKVHQLNINSLKENLNRTQVELRQIRQSKINLEEKLKSAQIFINNMIAKDNEAKRKVSEAVDLVESVVKEKEIILKREAQISEERTRLESSLAKLSEEYTNRLETEVVKAKETYNKNVKKYLLEIKELKAQMREQGTLLDRSQREYRLVEEELEKARHNSNNFVQRSNNMRNSNFEQSFQEKVIRVHNLEESHKNLYDDRINYLEHQITHLQDKLINTSEKLKRVQMQSSRNVEDYLRDSDDRTRELLEKCSNFEKQLSRALIDKENLYSNLHTLEMSFEKEMQKRNDEKLQLENKVIELQEKIVHADGTNTGMRGFSDDLANRRSIDQQNSINLDPVTSILALQEKYEKKTTELTQHVEIHQKLSNKWKEEANLLTSKFQKRTQELKNKMSILQSQNEELSRELLVYQKLLAQCNSQLLKNYDKDSETR